ncbi:hypothetical protein PR202_gb06827 [Eleusine coracana subsp. coracana]|uniref:F-box domain-containing protein n=1 Tax=Eleusine coracana subsp. coracana TaxID=191504 RepID=A0AAV5EBC1_ELECO|nr:hypothetical protein QOZ80_2BG0162470 [Eleusine coracana subsp. coracana]GJN19540.1 hypothetical protein PR202_gb06827 [Eleusine coracana subsp. coracana]
MVAPAPVLPEELVVWEILFRLPAKVLLRCLAVCRSWRRLTSAADFLLAHHRRQPSLPLVSFIGRPTRRFGVVEAAVDAFDLRRSAVERRPVLRFTKHSDRYPYTVLASCDGLLLLAICGDRFHYICNPTTRQSITLSSLNFSNVLGMYPHRSSGKYRILYWKGRQFGGSTRCYVISVGSSTAPRDVGSYLASGLCFVRNCPSVLLHGCLHWLHREEGKVLVFDTVGESFRWMTAPIYDDIWEDSHLVQIDGTLGISQISTRRTAMKLWLLQNYEAEVWFVKYQIEFPVAEISIANSSHFHGMVLSANGDVLVYCDQNSNLFHCDCTGKLLQKCQWDDVFSWPTRQWFKESFVQHASFQRKDGRLPVRKPCFFQGL